MEGGGGALRTIGKRPRRPGAPPLANKRSPLQEAGYSGVLSSCSPQAAGNATRRDSSTTLPAMTEFHGRNIESATGRSTMPACAAVAT